MHGRRGADAWEAIKWLPRFLLMTLCLVLIVYIFSVMIRVDYDPLGLRVESALAMLSYTDVFAHDDDPRMIDIERFTASSLESIIPLIEQEAVDSETPIVEELSFAKLAARLTLSSLDGSFEDQVLYYERESFERLVELYVSGARTSSRFARSENIVRVIRESDVVPAKLSVEVVIV